MVELLRALLDQPPGRTGAVLAQRGRRQNETPQDQVRRRAMNKSATRDAYGTLIEPTTLKIQRLLPGPIERIWAYLVESDKRRKWLAAGQMELKVGAPFELVWRNDELTNPPGKRPEGFDAEHRMPGHIPRLDPPRLLAFTFQNDTEVSIELEAHGSDILL